LGNISLLFIIDGLLLAGAASPYSDKLIINKINRLIYPPRGATVSDEGPTWKNGNAFLLLFPSEFK
jgi:hypothetical protein